MSRHLTFNDLIARHHGALSPEEKLKMEQHLSACEQCAQSAELLPSLMTREKKSGKRIRGVKNECLSHEDLSMFLNGELSLLKARKVEKHLALCDECREKLADIIRASLAPVHKEEKARVEAQSPLVIVDQVRAIENILAQEARPKKTWGFPPLLDLFAFLSHYKIAWAALVLVFGIGVGQRPLRVWQSDKYVASSLDLMQDTYTVHRDDLRPHGFPASIFSEHHGSTPEEKLRTIESKLQKALSWNIENREAKRAQALACYFEHNYPRADSLLKALLKEDAHDFAAWNDLGVIAAQREDTSAALEAFDRALELEPEYEEARHNRELLTNEHDSN